MNKEIDSLIQRILGVVKGRLTEKIKLKEILQLLQLARDTFARQPMVRFFSSFILLANTLIFS